MEDHDDKPEDQGTFDIVSVDIALADLRHARISQHKLFGGFPILEIADLDAGAFQISIENHFRPRDRSAAISLLDLTWEGGLPSAPHLLIDGGTVGGPRTQSHLLIPGPAALIASII